MRGQKMFLSSLELGFWAPQEWAFFDEFQILAAKIRAQKKDITEWTNFQQGYEKCQI